MSARLWLMVAALLMGLTAFLWGQINYHQQRKSMDDESYAVPSKETKLETYDVTRKYGLMVLGGSILIFAIISYLEAS